MFSAAAAAGISVAFGAPIGGVLFSLEEVSFYFPHKTMWRAFFCACIAALTLQFMNPFHNGKIVIFQVNYDHTWMAFEIMPFLVLGLFGGILGSIFIKLNLAVVRLRMVTSIGRHPIIETIGTSPFPPLPSLPSLPSHPLSFSFSHSPVYFLLSPNSLSFFSFLCSSSFPFSFISIPFLFMTLPHYSFLPGTHEMGFIFPSAFNQHYPIVLSLFLFTSFFYDRISYIIHI